MIKAVHLTKTYRIAKQTQGSFAAIHSLLQRDYIEKRAVDDISFTIEPGELVGYIGPNGAGKSTTIKMLSGILVPTSGEITVNGLDPSRQHRKHAKQIGVVFGQKTSLCWDVPAIDSFRLCKEIYDIPNDRFRKNLDAFTEILEMQSFLSQPVRQLSLGQRMRAELAVALLHDPHILFLDEPTIGLDVTVKENLRQFILDTNKSRGITTLLTTHDMVDMEKLANRIIVINTGKIIYDGSIHGLREKYGRSRRIDIVFVEENPQLNIPGLTEHEKSPFHRSCTFDPHVLPAEEILIRLTAQPCTIRDISIREADIEEVIRSLYAVQGGDHT